MRLNYAFLAFVCVASLALSACGLNKKDNAPLPDQPVETLYNNAADALDAKKYKESIRLFDEVERQHPYSPWATRAQLMSAFAAYKGQDYDVALVSLDRFVRLNPGYKDVDYALYLKGLSYYEQVSDIKRDQAMSIAAKESFENLLSLFPDSTYARDARLKRDVLLDQLAGKEMEVGRFYLKRDLNPAAIKRFQNVVKDYQTTTHAPEALYRLVEAYTRLGVDEEATRVAAVLGYNYPGSIWYDKAYGILQPDYKRELDAKGNGKRGFWGKAVDSLFYN